MKIRKITDFNIIAQFLAHTFSAPTHWPDWNLIISKHYNLKFYYFGAYENNQLIGICPIYENREHSLVKLTSGQVYYIPYGGWIFNNPVNLILNKTPLSYNRSFCGFTLPIINEFNVNYLKSVSGDFQTLIIDLKKPYDEIFHKSYEHKARKAIRKALKNQVTITINNDLELFYPYYIKSCEVRNLTVQTKLFFNDLFTGSTNIKFEISWASQGSQLLGFLVIIYDKNFAIGFWSYMFPESPKLGQGDLLIDEAVRHSQKYGCDFFDLCYIEKERLPNIYEFKKGFSQNEIPIINFAIRSLSYRLLNKITK